MKLIIAGTRYLNVPKEFIHWAILRSPYIINQIDEIVSGDAAGIDLAGEQWADWHRKSIKRFNPNWDEFGKAAGPIRNAEMARYGDALLLIWDGQSKGSTSIKKEMNLIGKPIYEIILKI